MFFGTFRLLFFILLIATAAAVASGQTETRQQQQPAEPARTPVSYGLAVDNSGSLRSSIGDVVGAATRIVESNGGGDETFVVRFISSEQVQVIQDLTRSKSALVRAVEGMYVEGGETAVVDAVYLSADYFAKNVAGDDANRRRALVLLTDGEDRGSYYKIEKALQSLRENRIRVYVLGFPGGVRKAQGQKPYEKAVALINTLARESGGHAVIVKGTSELTAGAEELLKHLRSN